MQSCEREERLPTTPPHHLTNNQTQPATNHHDPPFLGTRTLPEQPHEPRTSSEPPRSKPSPLLHSTEDGAAAAESKGATALSLRERVEDVLRKKLIGFECLVRLRILFPVFYKTLNKNKRVTQVRRDFSPVGKWKQG